jgi:hypothetical protein
MIDKASCLVFGVAVFFTGNAFSQITVTDSTINAIALQNSIHLYHDYLSPETGLYDGSEYPFSVYYPTPITEGDPFFYSTSFDSGVVCYNDIVYNRVPLLYDVIQQELLISDPSGIYIIRLDNSKVKWFSVWGFNFVNIGKEESSATGLSAGYYEVLYNGPSAVYKWVSKIIKQSGATASGLNTYTINAYKYYIRIGGTFNRVKNKKSLLSVFKRKKKSLQQFLRVKKIKIKKQMDYGLASVASWYDGNAK